MAGLSDESRRQDLVARLKRAEDRLRGVQRMIADGQPGLEVATQMVAVRRTLDRVYEQLTMSYLQQEVRVRVGAGQHGEVGLGAVLDEVQSMLRMIR
jgi:DNA-binding FrmR family transcriptional regulator